VRPPIRPYLQGELDALCGIYAIINALRALCREIDQRMARALFARLARRLATRHPGSVAHGMDGGLLRVLLASARRFVRDELAIIILAEDLKLATGASLSHLWEALAQELHSGAVAIVTTEGRHDHWTVAYQVTPRTLRLLDSSRRRFLRQSHCTVVETKTKYHLLADEIILLRRASGWGRSVRRRRKRRHRQ
jgi:hypothetical protein